MTGPQTTTPLSSVAQFVLDALPSAPHLQMVNRAYAAAALRAAVAQVVPESGKFLSPGTAAQIRAGFLAIAAELDPTTGTSGGDYNYGQ